ncbi:MAG: hypothetical protein GXO63_00535 [Candidatus Micrarchaeota archaeon]|nr:hypothetical protein [Candidatus Micrarchaeota archaeon]
MVSEKDLRKALEEFIESTGVLGAALVTNEGLLMTSLLPEDVDPNLIAAMAASLFGTSERVANELKIGNLHQAIVEAKGGKIVTCSTGENGIIVVLVPHEANMGLIMLELGRISEKIRKLLS